MDDILALSTELAQNISRKEEAYENLLGLWRRVREVIAESDGRSRGIRHYAIVDREDESWIGFTFCGVECYVAFRHDFENGCLEYGVLDPLSEPRKRIRVAELPFSQEGKAGEHWLFQDNRWIWYAHFSFVNEHAEKFAAAYFGAWCEDQV